MLQSWFHSTTIVCRWQQMSITLHVAHQLTVSFFWSVFSEVCEIFLLFLPTHKDLCLITWKKVVVDWGLIVTYSPEANLASSFNKCKIYIFICWCWAIITRLMNERYVNEILRNLSMISRLLNFPPWLCKQVKEGLEKSEVADYMRGLGFFPSDYQVECLHHELQVSGKRKLPFEDLVKLFVNHSATSTGSESFSLEKSLRNLLNSPADVACSDIIVDKSQLISILTESAEKIDEKDAEFYLKELFRGKVNEEVSLFLLIDAMTRIVGNNNLCAA